MPDLPTLAAGLLGLGAVVFYLIVTRRRLTQQRLERATDVLKEALYQDLFLRLSARGPAPEASRVAATVVNEVFGLEPPDEEAREFRESRKSLIQTQVARLASDGGVRPLIGAALGFMESPAWKNKPRPKGGLARAVNLGLIDPAEEKMPVFKFLAQTAEYHKRIKRESTARDKA